MNENNVKFLQEYFKKYYFEHFDLIHVPERPSEREFGFQKFNSGMTRHLTIRNDKELHLLLMNNIPSDVFCSNAYYSFPNLPMNEKDWKEADLIFDIDAKDLNLECRPHHSITKCQKCNHISQNNTSCENCNSTNLESKSLTCQDCITSSKNEVKKLINILTEDLGVESENIQIYFSGNEGFHIYVYKSQFQTLGSRERADLADYIMFKGIIPETLGMKKFRPERSLFPRLDEKGWRGRFAEEIFSSKSKRSKIISDLISNGYSNFQNKLAEISNKLGVRIDPNVTIDVHRIFRLPGSLNSKSGLAKILCNDMEKFDPYTNACHISEHTVKVKATSPIQFKLKNKRYGPYKDEIIEVPAFAATYMICKGFADIC